jgi:hypothetical protein
MHNRKFSSQLGELGEVRVKTEKAVNEAYLINAKEKIVRLVERKRERESSLTEMAEDIKNKCLEKMKKRSRLGREGEGVKESGSERGWERLGRQAETERYRDRVRKLGMKHQRTLLTPLFG